MRKGQFGPGRFAVLAIAAVLCAGGGVLIAQIVGSSEEDIAGTASKVLYTTLALTVFGACAAVGLLLTERRSRWAPFGFLTTAVALAGFGLMAYRILDGFNLYEGGDTTLQGIGLILTLTLTQAALAIAYDGAADPLPLRLLTLGTVVSILSLGVLGALAVAIDDFRPSDNLTAVLATLYLLGAALLVLFHLAGWLRRRSEVGSVPLDHVVIAVSDRDAAVRFYTGLLGAEVVERPEGRIAFRIGEQLLNVHEPGTAATPLARDPVRPGNSDLCFAWPGSPQLAVELVGALGAELVKGPVPRSGARGPGQSVYCRDPDGSLIELISYR